MSAPRTTRKVLGRLSLPERTFVADALRTETVGGVLLLVAAIAALIWANIPALHDSYESVSHFHLGPEAIGLNLSVEHWAADGLLAVFFFVAGIELKRELVAGDLRDPGQPHCRWPPPCAAWPYRRSSTPSPTSPAMARSRAGRCPRPPTSPSPWRSSRSSVRPCPAPCAPSSSPWPSSTTSSRS